MKPFSLLIKPTSADCNMNCSYCFYLDKSKLYPHHKRHRMSYSTLERIISSYMETNQPQYAFGWQGGEPTLMGQDFFKKVVELQKKYGKRGAIVTNSFQTNGINIDDEFAKFFSNYNFLIGVSLDGPEYIHDHYRKLLNSSGSFRKVISGIDYLRKNKVEFNILTLVNNFNIDKVEEVYRFLYDNSFYYHQYIPCVEFDDNKNLSHYSINGDQWGNFLIRLFNLWYPNDIYKVSIRLFDSILNYLVYGNSTICHMRSQCNQYLVVEYNGDVYPCDFFVTEDSILGNILYDYWEDILYSKKYKYFGKEKTNFNSKCVNCDYLNLCYGDCLKYRVSSDNCSKTLSWLCSGWKNFYHYSLPSFKKIADKLKQRH